jgi:5-deoxy-glucuronate isomerase
MKLVRYAETSQDPGLKFTSGGTGSTRQLNLLIAKNVQAGRLLVGFTHSEPGNWTSWPPHEHTTMPEEL